jgi:PAS domain S-box-containing protein
MKPVKAEFPGALPIDGLVPLDSILRTEELRRRPSRPPDYETENSALAALVQAMADSPRTILQTLADTILKVVHADSAGMSLLTKDEKRFHWAAIAGTWRPHLGRGTPREFGPCGDVLNCNAPLLFTHWERRYPYLLAATPPAEEGLLIPFHVGGKAVGTIWAIAHDDRRKFDAEDLRQLENLGRFASAAYQAVASLDALEQRGGALRQSHTELAHGVVTLQNARDSRRAALNLMEDAIRSRQAMERLNAKVLESEERYRTLFDLGPIAVYSCDASGVIQKFNRRAAELWDREPALGDTDERFCGSFKLFRPDGSVMPHDQCPMAQVVSGTLSGARDAEVLIERSDGSRVTVLVNVRPLKNQGGEITGAINCFYDITERKTAEVMVDSQRQALQRLAEGAPLDDVLGFLIGVVERYSAEGMLASIVPLNEAGTHFQRGIGATLPDAFNSAIEGVAVSSPSGLCADALRRREAVAVCDFNEVAAWQPFGTFLAPYGLRSGWSVPIVSSSGHMLGTFANYYRHTGDPTPQNRELVDMVVRTAAIAIERNQVEQEIARLLAEARQRELELREKQEQLVQAGKLASSGELATGVAHELNNPLNNIGLFVGNLIDRLSVHEIDAGRVSADLHKVLTQVFRAAQIITQLRTFARAARDGHQRIAIHEVIQSAINLVQEPFRLQNIEIALELDPSNPMVLGNHLQLEQVFVNLLTNAHDAMKDCPEKSLSIATVIREQRLQVRLADTGMGIPAEVLPRIFDPFFTTKDVGQGTGLGLSISYGIIKEHRGTITADNRPGPGTILVIELPLAGGDARQESSDR